MTDIQIEQERLDMAFKEELLEETKRHNKIAEESLDSINTALTIIIWGITFVLIFIVCMWLIS